VVYISDDLPHPYFYVIYNLTGGDFTLHKQKLKEMEKTPYIWVLTYLETIMERNNE
jgi:hypothetical protein